MRGGFSAPLNQTDYHKIFLDFVTLPGPLNCLTAFQFSNTSLVSGIYTSTNGSLSALLLTSGSASLVTPEPPTLALLGSGLFLLGLSLRRRLAGAPTAG